MLPHRRRLLVLSSLILAAVSITAVLLTAIHSQLAAAEVRSTAMAKLTTAGVPQDAIARSLPEPALLQSLGLVLAQTLAVVIAGATLLVRVVDPLMQQMEQHLRLLSQMRDNLQTQAAELKKSNAELDNFTYVASHDLKEPLRGISSYCQILREDYHARLDADGRRRLEALVALCRRLEALIDDLLTYSRIGRQPHVRAAVDVEAVLADVLHILGPAIEERRAAVVQVGALPATCGDANLLGELLRNLITNGMKFNDSPAPEIEVGALPTTPPTYFVRDNGIGIPPEHHQTIFVMFRRLHSRKKYDGTGAGLTLVRKIVDAHDGRLWLESQPGAGTTFYFTLQEGEPALAAEDADAPVAAPVNPSLLHASQIAPLACSPGDCAAAQCDMALAP